MANRPVFPRPTRDSTDLRFSASTGGADNRDTRHIQRGEGADQVHRVEAGQQIGPAEFSYENLGYQRQKPAFGCRFVYARFGLSGGGGGSRVFLSRLLRNGIWRIGYQVSALLSPHLPYELVGHTNLHGNVLLYDDIAETGRIKITDDRTPWLLPGVSWIFRREPERDREKESKARRVTGS